MNRICPKFGRGMGGGVFASLQGYCPVTDVDLANQDLLGATIPTIHLQKQLAAQRARSEASNMLGFTLATVQLGFSRTRYSPRRLK
jgi:hypothetical protein